ncbi:hypothetical protein MRB53_023676 [Persea americana]|uniref:Uncharacterized protein n=1 Tax=Persea americana TaxID=3435 RepID=A0ACC2LAM2_PERAE|nr:hypothetical protein MRB53_023676 [Persea americana]
MPSLLHLPSQRAAARSSAPTSRPQQPLPSPDDSSATPAPIFIFRNVAPAHSAAPTPPSPPGRPSPSSDTLHTRPSPPSSSSRLPLPFLSLAPSSSLHLFPCSLSLSLRFPPSSLSSVPGQRLLQCPPPRRPLYSAPLSATHLLSPSLCLASLSLLIRHGY